jgi:acetyl esterase/lipase
MFMALPLGISKTASDPVTAPAEHSMRLWEYDAPGAQGCAEADIPTLKPFFAPDQKNASAPAFIVCPGGGYENLAAHEGAPFAEWLNTLGIHAFVLKYRLGPKYHHPVEMQDIQRAIRQVRSRADEWHIDPKRIGVIGSSAGGHLASTAATHFDDGNHLASDPVDRAGCRPDLAILLYPVISMMHIYPHSGSRLNLLGNSPDPVLLEFLSNELQVTSATPPCFIIHAADDRTVPVQNSLLFAMACKEKQVPFELHVFENGDHGFGLGGDNPILNIWPGVAAKWLRTRGFAEN